MASGRVHDKASVLISLPLGVSMGLLLGISSGLVASVACVFGGLWLSPDLDTRSNALRRWGVLGFLWWPYRTMIPHRSVWSHGPLIGTVGRLLLLLGWLSLLDAVIPALGARTVLPMLHRLWKELPHQTIAGLIGLEASVWLHLLLDGDPLPGRWGRGRRQ